MTLSAAGLLIVAAILHAGWNLFGKRGQTTAAMFLLANTLGGLILLPGVILYGQAAFEFPGWVWLLILTTGFFQALYYAALAAAYQSGDLSVAYPLVRALPVLLVAALTAAIYPGKTFSGLYLLGAALVVVGCLLIPLRSLKELNWRSYLRLTVLLALIAAVGTVGYSMIDDAALRGLRELGLSTSNFGLTLLYSFLECISASVWLASWVLLRPGQRKEFRSLIPARLGQAALMGAAIYLAYTLVLVAMGYARNVSYVVTFRQLSIPLGAAAGMLYLGEERSRMKILGVAAVFAGLVLVGFG